VTVGLRADGWAGGYHILCQNELRYLMADLLMTPALSSNNYTQVAQQLSSFNRGPLSRALEYDSHSVEGMMPRG
jgi:hypothetical protein